MSGNEVIVSHFLKRGADPTRATSTLINFKRATWPIFHPHSKYSDNHYESDDCSNDEFNNEAGDEYSNIDRDNDDCGTEYGDDDQIAGYIPSMNGKTTALHIAALIGNASTIKKLLRKARDDFGSQVFQTESSPLIIAAWLGNTGVVKALLPYESQFSFKGFLHTPLQAASARGHLDIVKFLLRERDVNIASGGYPTPLCAASRHGKITVAALLIKHGAEVNPQSARVLDTPLSNAMINSQFEAIRFLLRKGAMFNPALLLEKYCRINEEALVIVLQHAMEKQQAEWRYNALCIQCRFGDYDYEVTGLL
ncbi:hypothetical protein N7471_010306 [Penicillium samsonianum]|uniref:uncharacterized protein n=1 Tax=Penicillium samsonianum TaxID=1882272 RepID=UPI002547EF2B|nr:uncharacterized protein N7471_010306 [Penicillium samsonianum]KAJ6125813.1 hypothetical protein N7471_010306 [Penicillium samsonianum]